MTLSYIRQVSLDTETHQWDLKISTNNFFPEYPYEVSN